MKRNVKNWRSRLAAALLFILASGCSGDPLPTLMPTATDQAAPSPTVQATATSLPSTPSPEIVRPTETDTAVPSMPTVIPTATAIPAPKFRPRYHLAADVDARAHTVLVTATVSLAPPGDVQEVVFNVNALQAPGTFRLLDLQVNAAPVAARSEGVWMHVPLPDGSQQTGPVTVTFVYELTLSPIPSAAWGWRGTLGWTSRQINLGDWYPVLAVFVPQQGWITHSPTEIGEYQTAETADYEVALRATGFASEPIVLGSGQSAACAARCFTLSGGRFVAYVLSDQMQSQSAITAQGVTVTSAYFPGHFLAGRAALAVAVTALERYGQLYGPYPYATFALVEGDLFDGMEYSGMSFVSETYYSAFDQSANNLLTAITAHETAHQWWYDLVGNDQALEPWLDEALCTYSEVVYLEAAHPKVVPNWWSWRINIHKPAGAVNRPIYAFASFRPYVDTVYLRGAQMLQAMRQAVGDERFFAFLRQYAQDNGGRVATATDFWSAYEGVGGDAPAIRMLFFAGP